MIKKNDNNEKNFVPMLAISTSIGAGAGLLFDNLTLGAVLGFLGGLINSFYDRIKPKPIRIKVTRYD